MKKAFYILTTLLLLPACGEKQVDKAHGPPKEAAKCGKETAQALTDAVKKGNLDKVRELLEAGVDVSARNEEGKTPLHFAAKNGDVEMVELLITEGAQVNAKDEYGTTPLHKAANRATADYLIAKGADVNAISEYCSTPLCQAASRGDFGTVRLLISKGACVGRWDLNKAVEGGHKEVARLLIAEGADVNEREYDERTLLHLAAQCGHKEIAEMLIANGADVNARDFYGKTPLHSAARSSQGAAMVEFLIAKGADPDANDADGNRPVDLAEFDEIKVLLRKHGGKSGKELKQNEGK